MDGKLDNVVNLFDGLTVDETLKETMNFAQEQIENRDIVNCMIILVEEDGSIIYSYSNFNKKITMVGALETLKNFYIQQGGLTSDEE